MILKAYKYRLYPTEVQSGLINKHIGSSRKIRIKEDKIEI